MGNKSFILTENTLKNQINIIINKPTQTNINIGGILLHNYLTQMYPNGSTFDLKTIPDLIDGLIDTPWFYELYNTPIWCRVNVVLLSFAK